MFQLPHQTILEGGELGWQTVVDFETPASKTGLESRPWCEIVLTFNSRTKPIWKAISLGVKPFMTLKLQHQKRVWSQDPGAKLF